MKVLLALIFCLSAISVQAAVPTNADELQAFRLAKLFYAARAAIGENPKFIDDPTAKEVKKAEILEAVKTNYKRMAEEDLDVKSSPALTHLWNAIDSVLDRAIKGEFKGLWTDHPNFPGKLIPARFGREVTDFFNKANAKYAIRWTTSDEYLVNQSSKADDWEVKAINDKFKAKSWKQGAPFSETVAHNNATAFRYALPEYFKTSCMGCHGGEMGKKIHHGKSAAGSGTFGGILSVRIQK